MLTKLNLDEKDSAVLTVLFYESSLNIIHLDYDI